MKATGKVSTIEKALLQWLRQVQKINAPTCKAILMKKNAEDFLAKRREKIIFMLQKVG